MELEINTGSPSAVYQQIVDQIMAGVLSGALSSGDSLPPIRQLAADLSLNPNTVAKAYKQLENQRVIKTARRAGTFIRDDASENCVATNHRNAEVQLDEVVLTFKQRGISDKEIAELLHAKISELET